MEDRFPGTNSRKHVLIVDDEDRLRSVLARYLRARGHHVIEASSAADAREALITNPIDVLLLDINLADDTGWDVMRWLDAEANHVARQPLVVIVSAAPPSPKRLAQFQPDGILNKPFSIDALARLVESGCQVVDRDGLGRLA
jgi:DNA-binding response OmpR family regulator